ncbi:hypothetical protein P9112_002583 [Eukaryota sp. TZLM1-RC]
MVLSSRKLSTIEDPLWFKDAVFYELYVRAFSDSNASGSGDFMGLTSKLAYLKWLGVDVIWILPHYPSPLFDDGYDVADYTNVHPDYGTLSDFDRFISAAHDFGLKVLVDFVVNHTSDQHPWFQAARSDRNSPYRDYYVWSDTDSKYKDVRIIFCDTESSNWTYDEIAGQYYWHRFFSSQPDLNYDNPQVKEEIFNAIRFWCRKGIDGFRVDAVPYLIQREGTSCENLPETHSILKEMRAMIDKEFPNVFLLCEANMMPEDVVQYFGTPEEPEFHSGFHFPVMPRIFMSLVRGECSAIKDILHRTPAIPSNTQWMLFLRNHDELTLEMVTPEEREWMWSVLAGGPREKQNLGIRRRLASICDYDNRKILMLNALLFSLPGSPIIYYGDEIGMGDNLFLRDRDGQRLPMQWDPRLSLAGFSQSRRPYANPVGGGPGSPVHASVAVQQLNENSLLHKMKNLIATRKQSRAFGRGSYFVADCADSVFAIIRVYGDEMLLCCCNMTSLSQVVSISFKTEHLPANRTFERVVFTDMLSPFYVNADFDKNSGSLIVDISLCEYGFMWLRLE